MTVYIVKWWMPVLADWIKVGDYRTLGQARDAEACFTRKLSEHWSGMSQIKTAIVEVTETERT